MNKIVWADIPVIDLDRAIQFYNAILETKVYKQQMPEWVIGIIEHEDEEAAACLFIDDEIQPSSQGPVVYFNVDGYHEKAEKAVEANGGKVLMTRHEIGPYGYRTVLLDSEGNRIAIHSRNR